MTAGSPTPRREFCLMYRPRRPWHAAPIGTRIPPPAGRSSSAGRSGNGGSLGIATSDPLPHLITTGEASRGAVDRSMRKPECPGGVHATGIEFPARAGEGRMLR